MSSVSPHTAGHAGRVRKTLRDLAVGIVWIAGFLCSVQAPDGVTMAIGISLMTISATFLAFRGGARNAESGHPHRLSLWRLLNVAAWVTLGPMLAAYVKLQMIVGGSFGQ
ncbi:hypothetical protein GC170_01535 [bacterium]|nr:hypothetical protein [bacterium]